MRAVVLGLLLSASVLGGEPIAVARLAWETGALAGARAVKVPLAGKLPEAVRPPAKAEGAQYGSIETPTLGRVVLALGKRSFWLDGNRNGSLADEKPAVVPEPGKAWNHLPTVRAGEREIALRFYLTGNCTRDHVHFVSLTHLQGEVVLEGRLRTVALDGKRLLLDLDGDGALDSSWETLTVGEPFRLRGAVLTSRAVGECVEFRPGAGDPAPRAATWRPLSLSRYTLAKKEPGATLADLARRFRKEQGLDYAKRLPTLRAIAALHDAKGFEFLFDIARNGLEHTTLRTEAVRAMGQEGFRAFADRVAYIAGSSADPLRAEVACQVLHTIDYPERESVYLRVLETGKGVAVRGAAAGLVLLGKSTAVERLVREGKGANVPAYAYYGLRYGKQAPPAELVRDALRRDDPLLRSYALQDLSRTDPEQARTGALESIEFARKNLTTAYQVADILGRAGDAESVRALFTLVPGAHPNLLTRIRKALGPVRDDGATAAYLRALGSDDAVSRALAASLLANLPGRKSTDALVKRVKREKDPGAMQAMLEALGEHGDPRSVSTLLRLAKSKDPGTRIAALQALARLGSGVRKVRDYFLRLLTSKRWQERVYALDVAGAVGNRDVAVTILKNLDHKHWQVRHAAVEALGKLRVREAVAPLIKRLEKEEVQRVRAAIAHTLFVTTGMNLYDFAETWARWWVEHGGEFEVPTEIPQRRKVDAGGTVASFYGLPLDSGRVAFVIDRSGSMSAVDQSERSRLETAIAETLGAVGRLKARDKVNVILFDNLVRAWQKKLVPLTPANRAQLEKHLRRQEPTGATNLYDALEAALADQQVDTVFLLSDGAPSAGKFTVPADVLRAVGRLNQARRIAIHCVSVGRDSDLLKKLAAANGGKYVRR